MKEVEISDLLEYLQGVELWGTKTRLYRGVSDPSFELRPSIGRVEVSELAGMAHVPGASITERRDQYERELLKEFKRRSLPFLSFVPRSELEWLCLAQHYGVPTRLLDWTTNPLIALYFACEHRLEMGGAVYVRHQPLWRNEAHDDDPFREIDSIVAVQPEHSDKRFVNQEGVFTLQPDPRAVIDDDSTWKIRFDARAKGQLQWQLGKFGIRASVIYPGLDGVAKDVRAVCETTRTGTVPEANPRASFGGPGARQP